VSRSNFAYSYIGISDKGGCVVRRMKKELVEG